MITNIGKKVICMKEIPSNIIEEAFFILKTDVEHVKNSKLLQSKKNLVLQEANDFVTFYQKEFEKQRIKEKEWQKKQKRKLIILAVCFVVGCLLLSLILNP